MYTYNKNSKVSNHRLYRNIKTTAVNELNIYLMGGKGGTTNHSSA